LRVDTGCEGRTVSRARPACDERGKSVGGEYLRDDPRPTLETLRIQEQGDHGIPGTASRSRRRDGSSTSRIPGMLDSAQLLPAGTPPNGTALAPGFRVDSRGLFRPAPEQSGSSHREGNAPSL